MGRFVLPNQRVGDNNNKPLDGAKLLFFENGTSTPKDTFSDVDLTTPNANPVVADDQGQFANIFLDGIYRVRLDDKNNVTQQGYPRDDVNKEDPIQGEWILYPETPVFIGATQFSVTDDQTTIFQVGRRIQATVTAGTVYGVITASSFAASITTVTVSLDSGNLDSGLSEIFYGLLSVTNPAIPTVKLVVVDGTIRTNAASIGQIQDGDFNYVADTGAVDVYVADFSPAFPSYVTGMVVNIKITNTSTVTAPTLNVNSLGAKVIVKAAGALLTGDLVATEIHQLVYDGTNFILLNPFNIVPFTHSHDGTADSGGQLGQDALDLVVTAGDITQRTSEPEETTTSATFVKMKEIRIPFRGTLRIGYDGKFTTGPANARIYRNGVGIGTDQALTGSFVTYEQDIGGWSAGDLVQVFAKRTNGSAEIENFYVRIAETGGDSAVTFTLTSEING